ncbi:MAG: hypothetical protein Kow0040_10830 [Thermogutta sp.]
MEARTLRAAFLVAATFFCCGAEYRSANFVIHNPDPQFAQQMGQAAEAYRKQLAVLWLGEELPNWSRPCPVTVQDGPGLGAGGQTTFIFDRGEVYGWEMAIQGSRERLLDSVLPHEITHMILASHFRRPLPRWADEGAATSVEHASEREKHRRMLIHFLRGRRGIPFNRMFAMEEYPRDIMPLYAQGFALADYLIQEGGHRRFVQFLEDGLAGGDWHATVRKYYGYEELGDLQTQWVAWVGQGYPDRRPRTLPVGLAGTQQGTQTAPTDNPQNMVAGEAAPGPQSTVGDNSSIYLTASAKGHPAVPTDSEGSPTAGDWLPRPGTPAADVDFGGWRPASKEDGVGPFAGESREQRDAQATRVAAATPTDPQVNRLGYPQPVERPQQIILEWSRPTMLR